MPGRFLIGVRAGCRANAGAPTERLRIGAVRYVEVGATSQVIIREDALLHGTDVNTVPISEFATPITG
jgi:hypothetical protein